MSDFDDAFAALTDAVFDHFGEAEAGQLEPALGGAATPVRVMVDHGTAEEQFARAGLVVGKLTLRIPFADAARLARGDLVRIAAGAHAGLYKLAGAPQRSGMGSTWEAPADLVAG